MPTRFKSICSYPGCNTITRNGRCEKHRIIDDRPQAQHRGYDHRWRKLRNWYIRANPICQLQVKCDGDAAEEVDHIKPIAHGGDALDSENLQSVCKPCHRWKTWEVDYPTGEGGEQNFR